jgi:hypothetical protein
VCSITIVSAIWKRIDPSDRCAWGRAISTSIWTVSIWPVRRTAASQRAIWKAISNAILSVCRGRRATGSDLCLCPFPYPLTESATDHDHLHRHHRRPHRVRCCSTNCSNHHRHQQHRRTQRVTCAQCRVTRARPAPVQSPATMVARQRRAWQ